MAQKTQLSLPRIALAIGIGWLAVIMVVATTIIAWRLTISPATIIADFIVPSQEVQE